MRNHRCRKLRLYRANCVLYIRYTGLYRNFDQTHIIFPRCYYRKKLEGPSSILLRWSGDRPNITRPATNGAIILFVRLDHNSGTPVYVLKAMTRRCTVGMNLVCVICLLAPSVPASYRASLPAPNLALQNVMTCRVFRLLKLGFMHDNPTVIRSSIPQNITTLRFDQHWQGSHETDASTRVDLEMADHTRSMVPTNEANRP